MHHNKDGILNFFGEYYDVLKNGVDSYLNQFTFSNETKKVDGNYIKLDATKMKDEDKILLTIANNVSNNLGSIFDIKASPG